MTASSRLAEGGYIGLSLDAARKPFSADGVAALVGRMGELGFTALHLHLTETARVAVRLPGFEGLAAEDAWGPHEIARIVVAAGEAGVAIVPEVDLPAHAAALLRGREHLQLVDDEGRSHPDRLDVSRPEARDLALALLDAVCTAFPGDTVHLGGDEYFAAPWENEREQAPGRFPSLVDHARSIAGPRATALDSYALFMNDLGRRARELGRTAMMWNDHVVPASDGPCVPISTEIVLDTWIRWRAWTPSILDYLDSGYRAITSHGDLLYLVLSDDTPPLPQGVRGGRGLAETFRPRRFMGMAAHEEHIDVPPVASGERDPVLGASLSLWCDAPDLLDEAETLSLLDTWLVPFAQVMREGTGARATRA